MPDEPRARVLIVDDDAWTREFFCEALRGARFEVVSAPTMAAALEALRRAPVDIIITDLQLPDVARVDVLATLRPAAPASRLIVCSGFVSDEQRAHALRFGAVAVLEKPVRLQLLVETVTAAV